MPGSIGYDQDICFNSAPETLIQTAPPTGGTGSYTYQWQISYDGITFSDIRGARLPNYSPQVLTQTRYYRRNVTSGIENSSGNVVLITVNNNLEAGTISSSQTICFNTVPTPLTQRIPPTGGSSYYSYQWQYSLNKILWYDVQGATGPEYAPPSLITNTYYRYVVTDNSCGTKSSYPVLITVRPDLTSGSIGSDQSICYNTVPALLTNIESPAGGIGTYSYQWQNSADNITWTNITGATDSTYSPPQLTGNTWYRRQVTSGKCSSVISNPVFININPLITDVILHDDMTIDRNTSANLNVEIIGGAPPYIINYARNGIIQTPILNYHDSDNIPTGILSTGEFSYNLISVVDNNGCTYTCSDSEITVTVTPDNTYHYDFTYPDRASFLADGWDFIARDHEYLPRNTEQTSGAVVSFDQLSHPGMIRIPVDEGDLWGNGPNTDNTRNSIFRNLDPTWSSIRIKISSFNPSSNFQQAGLLLYQNDWNYVQITRTYEYGNKITMASEELGGAHVINSINVSDTADIYLRLDREQLTENITGYYSLNGTEWILVGTENHSLPRNPSLAIVTGSSPGGYPNAYFEWAEIRTQMIDELRVYPNNLVFKGTENQILTTTRKIFLFTTLDRNINWSLSVDVPWLNLNKQSGLTTDSVIVGINSLNMATGIHTGHITFQSSQSVLPPVTVPVVAIINPDIPVKPTLWRDNRSGAMSVSVDDGAPSGFEELQRNGYTGTYVSNGFQPPEFYDDYYQAGMELGSHLYSHICQPIKDDIFRGLEIEYNLYGICSYTSQPYNNLITLVWPCGYTNYREQSIAADYFLGARGYAINQLEDPTPENFMKIKSFNTPQGSPPLPPLNLQNYVDLAISEHKWFNLVLHYSTIDEGAIDYSSGKDIWVTSIGTVIKYILQRDRTIFRNYTIETNQISFEASRLAIPSTQYKEFELAFGINDITTLEIDIDDSRALESILVDGVVNQYNTKNINGNIVLFTNVRLEPQVYKTIEVRYYDESFPRIILSSSNLVFNSREGSNPIDQYVNISSNIPDNFTWNVSVGETDPSWLSVNPGSGSGNGLINVSVLTSGLIAGTYQNSISVSSPESINSPQSIIINLTVTPSGIFHYDFTYPDRGSLTADGWDYIATTREGYQRDTEQTADPVSYDQQDHPGVISIPVGEGDLWLTTNNSENTLFRNLPSNWSSIRLFIPVFTPEQPYQKAGLAAYQDDNNYFLISRVFSYSQGFVLESEIDINYPLVNDYFTSSSVSSMYFRIDRDISSNSLTAYYSMNGSFWYSVGPPIIQPLNNPRLAIVTGGSPGVPHPAAEIAWAEVYITESSKANMEYKESSSDIIITGPSWDSFSEEKILNQNYPNPFTEYTNIEFCLLADGLVTMDIFNSAGKKVDTMINNKLRAGNYRYIWSAGDNPSGIYFVELKIGAKKYRMKMIINN